MMAQALLPTLPRQTIGWEFLCGRNIDFQCRCRSSHQDVAQSPPYIPRAMEAQERLIMEAPAVLYKAWVWPGLLGHSTRSWLRAGPVLLQAGLSSHPNPPPEGPCACTASILRTEPSPQALHSYFNVTSRNFIPITSWFLHLDATAFLNDIVCL